jgi:hypothetical protein
MLGGYLVHDVPWQDQQIVRVLIAACLRAYEAVDWGFHQGEGLL